MTSPAIAETPFWIVGFAFGASFVALFAQLGGGIYTKAADVGADLVGKVEAGIPEDDPRNPAVIADLVGDNVGDCAGRGADLFESSAAEIIGAMILGVALFKASGGSTGTSDIAWIFFPLVLAAFGAICSMVGVSVVRPSGYLANPMGELNKGFFLTDRARRRLHVRASASGCCRTAAFEFAICGIIGLLTSLAFLFITQYYTAGTYRPVREIAERIQAGRRDQHHLRHRGRHGDDRAPGPDDRRGAALLLLHRQDRSTSTDRTSACSTPAASTAPPWRRWAC